MSLLPYLPNVGTCGYNTAWNYANEGSIYNAQNEILQSIYQIREEKSGIDLRLD